MVNTGPAFVSKMRDRVDDLVQCVMNVVALHRPGRHVWVTVIVAQQPVPRGEAR